MIGLPHLAKYFSEYRKILLIGLAIGTLALLLHRLSAFFAENSTDHPSSIEALE
jgi:hypothetical protein